MPKAKKPINDTFIYTEIVRCGQIGVIALRSFFAYHPNIKVHVFGIEEDRSVVGEFKNVIFHSLDQPDPELEGWKGNWIKLFLLKRRSKQIAKNFDHGHLGTASLWAHLIQTRSETYMLHFDSDVVFRAEAVSDIMERLSKGFDIVGPIRNYKHNPHNDNTMRRHPDVVGTSFFAFNRNKIPAYSYDQLTNMCRGRYNPLGFEVIDFFDPVSFVLLKNGSRVSHLSVNDYGGQDKRGGRVNKYPELNTIVDFGDKTSHFSAVGSGMNFYRNRNSISDVPNSYVQYGLEKYAVYMKLFYNQDLDIEYDKKKYALLFKVKKWY